MSPQEINLAQVFQQKLRMHVGQNLLELLRMEAQIEGLQAEVARLNGVVQELERARADVSRPPEK